MAKLYPPVIEGTIPAFNGTTLVVPFSMNRAVSKADIGRFSAKIKTVQSNTFVVTLNNGVLRDGYAEFDIEDLWTPTKGQYYKLQLAYIGIDNTVGYYSTVGVVKYCDISSDAVYIENLDVSTRNIFMHDFVGVYDHAADPMEKVYQYRFILYKNDEIEYDSNWRLHDATSDASTDISVDTYTFFDDLEENVDYAIQYKIITVNGLELSTNKYPLTAMPEFSMSVNLNLTAVVDDKGFDNGYVSLIVHSEAGSDGTEKAVSGKFKIYRNNIKTPRRWEPIFNFVLQEEKPGEFIWKDFTVEHGETYRYKICQYNDKGILTTGAYSNEVYVDFEDMFLFDGKRQLKIQFNPKVSNFKNDILESKLETIGSKYPFFFRNGHVHYKEFPISGLISYLVDNEELFKPLEEMYLDNENLVRKSTPSAESLYTKTPEWKQENWGAGTEYVYDPHFKTTDLLNYNLAAEKKFKLDVLEWLTNGKPKLFRSPVEGNYIVRLMNTSLTPNDTVGRMLHTFQSTAYEIDDMTYTNLGLYGFLNGGVDDDGHGGIDEPQNNTVALRFRTIKLIDAFNLALDKSGLTKEEFLEANEPIEVLIDLHQIETGIIAQAITLEDCETGDKFTVDGEPIVIGATRMYNLNNLQPVHSVTFKPQDVYMVLMEANNRAKWLGADSQPQITYSYFSTFTGNTLFDMITDIAIKNIPSREFIGGDISSDTNIIDLLQDIKHAIIKYDYVELIKKPVEEIYTIINLSTESATKGTLMNEGFQYSDINKYFSFDKTGWGRGRDNKGATSSIKVPNYINNSTLDTTADLVKNMSFCIFHVNPTTVQSAEMLQKLHALKININTRLSQYVIDPTIIQSYLDAPTKEKRDAILALLQGDIEAVRVALQSYLDAVNEYRDGLMGAYWSAHEHYVLSEDITVDPEKEYYEKVETVEVDESNIHEYYSPVAAREGDSPKDLGWYEYTTRIVIDYSEAHDIPYNYDYDKFKYDKDYYLIYNKDTNRFKLYNNDTYIPVSGLTADTYVPGKYYLASGTSFVLSNAAYDTNVIYYEKIDAYETKVWMNIGHTPTATDEYFDLANSAQSLLFYDIDEIQDLYIGNGVICSLSYKDVETSYSFENERDVAVLKQEYLDAMAQYQHDVRNWVPPVERIDEETGQTIYSIWNPDPADSDSYDIDGKYKTFISALDARISAWREETKKDEE